MTRTIEGIVESHRLASERRAAGKPIWDRTINIKPILKEDPDNNTKEHAASVANRIGALLRSHVPAGWLDYNNDDYDDDLIDIVEGMEALKPDSYDGEADYSPQEDLHNMLCGLYDWADKHRVWLG